MLDRDLPFSMIPGKLPAAMPSLTPRAGFWTLVSTSGIGQCVRAYQAVGAGFQIIGGKGFRRPVPRPAQERCKPRADNHDDAVKVATEPSIAASSGTNVTARFHVPASSDFGRRPREVDRLGHGQLCQQTRPYPFCPRR